MNTDDVKGQQMFNMCAFDTYLRQKKECADYADSRLRLDGITILCGFSTRVEKTLLSEKRAEHE